MSSRVLAALITILVLLNPKEIRLRLRSGDGRPLVSAEVNGRKAAVLPGDVILLPTLFLDPLTQLPCPVMPVA
ncbi:MAG: hypothetical protein NTU53_24500 [Planctomycetota bacterium]|nr:hypothetical protein [Planctomycetota bacterium]